MKPLAYAFAQSALMLGGIAAASGLAVFSTPAEARIKCKEGYQVIDGRLIPTPYCSDTYLAQVAREFGTKVSARQIRNNPNKKREVCEFVGQDIRVRHICDAILPRRGI